MRKIRIKEGHEIKVKGIHKFPVNGIITDVYMDFEKNETRIKIMRDYEEVKEAKK